MCWALAALCAAPAHPQSGAALLSPKEQAELDQVRATVKAFNDDQPPVRAPFDGGLDALYAHDMSAMVERLSTGDGGLPFARYRWEVPGQQSAVDVPVVQVINGLPVRFSAAVSNESPNQLLKYYADAFSNAGLYIPPEDSQMPLGGPVVQLTALDTDNLISYSVILQVVDDKHTTVIMGQGYLTPWLQRKPPGGDFAPLFPAAKSPVRTHAEGIDLIQFTTSAEPSAVAAFYKATLSKAGYTFQDKDTFAKGQERIRVMMAKDKSDTAVMLQRRMAAPGRPGFQ